ncbi:Abhydrolase domain-containing protein 1 [Tetrabaena socialis]|uniref:Abhydrolase domain-containing protein 1 n=1 Tax=Tetrabaena socialis TaxID=47790 RepID=A0A2J7ZND8_9CHLO|nr:Abhydrolase domain-containing protein 1 [Tetrabaena socialis]|eukprot:PNH01760.1 Abhydrolase domain-containing protein 1 [Tetrabaena socialis]
MPARTYRSYRPYRTLQRIYMNKGIYKFFLLGVCERVRDAMFAVSRFHHEKPVIFRQSVEGNSDILRSCQRSLVRLSIPWQFQGAYAQSVFPSCSPFLRTTFTKETLWAPDGGRHTLAWSTHGVDADDTPILFCAHGMGASLDSHYIHRLGELCSLKSWRMVVHFRRGHEAPVVEGAALPTHGASDDTDQAVEHVHKRYPSAKKVAVGFSAGGNVIALHQGLKGDASRFVGAMVMSASGCDYEDGTPALSSLANEVLVSFMLNSHRDLLRARPRTLLELDSSLYPDVHGYYAANSGCTHFHGIARPFLSLSAMDDPLVPAIMIQKVIDAVLINENIIVVQTQKGGHMGWHTAAPHPWWLDVLEDYFTTLLSKD